MEEKEITDQITFRANSPAHPKLYDDFEKYLGQYGSERSKVLRELMAAWVRCCEKNGVPPFPFELTCGSIAEKPGNYGRRRK